MKVILFLFCLSLSISAAACSCNELPSIEDAYFMTPVVFSGKVISLNYVSIWETMALDKRAKAKEDFLNPKSYTSQLGTPTVQKIELEVLKTYKGENIKDTIVIFTANNGAACGFTWFEIGKKFIVYANPRSPHYNFYSPNNSAGTEQKGTYWTNQCTRTSRYYEEEAKVLELYRIEKINSEAQLKEH
jgi:hypothetical protein